MRLRDYIRAGATPPLATATVATLATLRGGNRSPVATVAGVAVADGPMRWLDHLRSAELPFLPAERWAIAAAALDTLLHAGVVEKALGLGWDARELIGVCRTAPHDSPSRAGLIFSLRPGDTVRDVRRTGCIIAYATVRHIWQRVPLPADGFICMPWELTA
jgi:hypothetical protein